MGRKPIDYNDIPVYFCAKCLSLAILHDNVYGDYCRDCGSLDIRKAHIYDWEKLHKDLK